MAIPGELREFWRFAANELRRYDYFAVPLYLYLFLGYLVADKLTAPKYEPRNNRDNLQSLIKVPYILALIGAPAERMYLQSPPARYLAMPALLLELVGIGVSLTARVQLGRSGTPHLAVLGGQTVMRRGIYSHIRHPIYLGFALILAGWLTLWMAPVVSALSAIGWALIFGRRIQLEEAMMVERFGEDYQSYMRDTWRLFPGV